MNKDYRKWHQVKTQIERQSQMRGCQIREIWWCALGENVGVEIDGKNHLFQRPVLIIRKFNQYMFLAVPLSTQLKTRDWYFRFKYKETFQTALLSQIRLVSSKRLIRKVGRLDKKTFKMIKNLMIGLLK